MKTAVFIDGVYLFRGLKGRKINFTEFKDWLVREEQDVTVLKYFNSMHDDERKKKFLHHVTQSGFDLYVREPYYSAQRESYFSLGVDVELAIEAVYNMDRYDKIILVSGTRDFLPLCEKLTLNNKKVHIVGFSDSIHKTLRKYNISNINEFLKKNIYIND